MDVLKVSANSSPKSVAGALAAVIRERGSAEIQAVGAGAVNQAVKAIAITRGYMAPNELTWSAPQGLPRSSSIVKNGPPSSLLSNLAEILRP